MPTWTYTILYTMVDLTKILQVGDPVTSASCGDGVVSKFELDAVYCIGVKYGLRARWYTRHGKYHTSDSRPTLYPVGTKFPDSVWNPPSRALANNIDPLDGDIIELVKINVHRDALVDIVCRKYYFDEDTAGDYLDALLTDYREDPSAWWNAYHVCLLRYEAYVKSIRTPEMDARISALKDLGVSPVHVVSEISDKLGIDSTYADHYRRILYAQLDK